MHTLWIHSIASIATLLGSRAEPSFLLLLLLVLVLLVLLLLFYNWYNNYYDNYYLNDFEYGEKKR